MTKKLTAKIKSMKTVFNGFFRVDSYDIEMDKHDGGTQEINRLVFERGHAVAILAYDPDLDQILLVNEMRVGILAAGDYPFTDSLPAGMIDAGETAIEAAKREMIEETNMVFSNTQTIHAGAYVSPGGTSEKITLVFGTVDMSKAGGVHGKEDEGESIKTEITSYKDFITAIENSEITDMKSVLAGYWLKNNHADIQLKYKKKPNVKVNNTFKQNKM